MDSKDKLLSDLASHYGSRGESERLISGVGALERVRTQEILTRFLPTAPATVVDVGGGAGVYACWLAKNDYAVHLIDAVDQHVEQAKKASASQPDAPLASAAIGDARSLKVANAFADAVLLLGPLYHLIELGDRLQALREAYRVVKPGGIVAVAAISRYASAMDGMNKQFIKDPVFFDIMKRDLLEGQHRNPTNASSYFTTTFFHTPNELLCEFREAGLELFSIYAVEGPAWLLGNFNERWADDVYRERLLDVLRMIECEPSLIGASAHLLAIGRRPLNSRLP